MAIMPGATYLNAATSAPMARYDIVCIHTIVGYAPAHAAHFSTKADGTIFQSRDTKWKSAANLNGNHRVIAIENEDRGPAFGNWNTSDGHQVPGFTAAQIESIAQICAWAYKTHGIPLVLAANSKSDSRGIAFHRQGCDGNFAGYDFGGRVAGGELWSSATGKVCPGDRRIHQLIDLIIPRARQIAGLDSEGFLMALTSQQQNDLYAAIDSTHRKMLDLLPIVDMMNKRVQGFLRQRWFKLDDSGNPVQVDGKVEGAIPATALDTLDGNYLVKRILDAEKAAKDATAAVARLEAQLAATPKKA